MNKLRKNLLDFLSGEENEHGKRIFNIWFQQSLRKFLATKSIDEPDDLDAIKFKIKENLDKKIAGIDNRFHSVTDYSTKNEQKAQRITPGYGFLKIAASVAFLLVATLSVWYLLKTGTDDRLTGSMNSKVDSVPYEIVSVPYGKKASFTLSDGTQIQLNSGSEIRFVKELSPHKREVFLTGEAFFNVAKDPERPFIVNTPGVSTTVLGTSFNVKAFDDEPGVTITVATGTVRVNYHTDSILIDQPSVILNSTEQVVYNRSNGELTHQIVKLESHLDWKNNTLNFDNESLKEIALVLERWYNVEIVFDDIEIQNCRFRGKMHNPRLNTILEAISFSTSIDFEVHDRTITLKGNPCI